MENIQIDMVPGVLNYTRRIQHCATFASNIFQLHLRIHLFSFSNTNRMQVTIVG